MDAIIVDLPQEIIKEAVLHLKEARKYDGNAGPFPLWREVRTTVLFAVTAIEAFMNKASAYYIQNSTNQDQTILDYLQEQERYVQNGNVITRQKLLSLETKVSEWTKIITGNNFDKCDSVWKTFREVKNFRNALVHYCPECPDLYNNANIAMAKKAILSAKNIMLRFYECSKWTVPLWLNAIYVDN